MLLLLLLLLLLLCSVELYDSGVGRHRLIAARLGWRRVWGMTPYWATVWDALRPPHLFSAAACGTRSDLWAQQVVVCGKENRMLQESVMNYLLPAIAL
jgi:hypothetical protein